MTNNSLTKTEKGEMAFNIYGYAGIIFAYYRFVKGLGVVREARRGGCSCVGGGMYKLASVMPQHSSSGETEDLNSDTMWEYSGIKTFYTVGLLFVAPEDRKKEKKKAE